MKLQSQAYLLAALTLAIAGCNSSSDEDENEKELPDVQKVRKSLLVMIDGARYEAILNASTPNLDKLSIQQAYTGGTSNTLSQSGTSTVEGESTLWTGSWHSIQKSGENGYKSVWQHMKASNPEMKIGLYPNWPIFDYVKFDLEDIPDKQAFTTGTDRSAEHVNAKAVAAMIDSGEFDSLFTTIDMVDYSGHCYYGNSGGAWSGDYIETIEEADSVFGYLYDAIVERETNFNEEWLVMVAPDHGFNRQKDNGSVDCSHGSQDIDAKKIWVAANQQELLNKQFISPLKEIGNRDKDGIYRYVGQTDVAPTLLAWHEVVIKPEWEIEGTPLIGDIGVRGLFAAAVEKSNQIEITFTPSNDQTVSIFRNNEEVNSVRDAKADELYTFVDELNELPSGSHTVTYTLINNNIPKSITTNIVITEDVDFDDLPFDTLSGVYTFDNSTTENSVVGGADLQTTGNPSIALVQGKFGQALNHIRSFNNDLFLDDNQTNTDKFTISMWFAGDGTSYDPAIITNKNWSSAVDGLILAQINDSLKLQVGMDGEGSCCFVQLPYIATTNLDNVQWNLLVLSVDKTQPWESGEGFGVLSFGVYTPDAKLHFGSVDLSGDRINSIHTGKAWLINNDHAQAYNSGHSALIDELAIWQGSSFGPSDVVALGDAERSIVEKLASGFNLSVIGAKNSINYLGQKPNMSDAEKQSEAFWQRRRQMGELQAELKTIKQ